MKIKALDIFLINIFFILLAVCFNRNEALCWWTRCCVDSESVFEGLESNITQSVFGQHLAIDPVLAALGSHLEHNPKKALVLSFHGPAGVGKTLLSKMIAHHLFGGELHYVKFYSGTIDFTDSGDVELHKDRLATEISDTVRLCGNAIFIFDEAHRMSDSLFDTLRPFTEYYHNYKGVDYRRAIFIFISNIGASEISDIYFNKRVKREDLTFKDFEEILALNLFNKKGGFKDSVLVTNFLVDYYIPFLPLEEVHIKKCISKELKDIGLQATDTIIKSIYDLLPKKKKGDVEYIASNCKRIGSEVGRFVKHLEIKSNRNKIEL